MSNFKSRLENAIQSQIVRQGSPRRGGAEEYSQYSDRKVANMSRLSSGNGGGLQYASNTSGSTSLLNERVSRISEKINQIHVSLQSNFQQNIERGKHGKLEEFEAKSTSLEQKFDEAIDTGESKFQIVDEQFAMIQEYLHKDRQAKEEHLKQKRDEIAEKEAELYEKFQLAEKQRFDLEKKFTTLIDEKAFACQQDLTTESKNRHESIEHIKSCLKSDFPKLEDMIRREQEERDENDAQLENHLSSELNRIRDQIDGEKKAREDTEETMIEMFKDMINRIKGEIDNEKTEREQAEEALLSLLEETCAKLNKSVAF